MDTAFSVVALTFGTILTQAGANDLATTIVGSAIALSAVIITAAKTIKPVLETMGAKRACDDEQLKAMTRLLDLHSQALEELLKRTASK